MLRFHGSGTGMTGEGEYGFPCKACEIKTSITRGDPASIFKALCKGMDLRVRPVKYEP
uniref:Uncharacterized protein n=1 Tax=Chlorobium phaeobacteroides (strain BS1) TaxID=331678 RepID=B3ELX3_CHLPB